MADPKFFINAGPFTLSELAEATGSVVGNAKDADIKISDVAPLSGAGNGHISFLDNPKYVDNFKSTKASACIIHKKNILHAPRGIALLISDNPYNTYALVASMFYPQYMPVETLISPQAVIENSASIGEQCEVEAGAVISHNAKIGAKCHIRANAVIGPGVIIGDNCTIHANASISHAVIGNNVIIHHGASIGQDGFGYAPNNRGEHIKVPQLGRVIIEDDVEVGANTTIDRGSGPDTIIGRGTKIDNLVQIGHNATIGKGCIIVAQVGISGSTRIGDYVVIGGQAGFAGHLSIGKGARIAAQSGVMRDVEPGSVIGGTPAIPMKQFHRQNVTLQKLAKVKDD